MLQIVIKFDFFLSHSVGNLRKGRGPAALLATPLDLTSIDNSFVDLKSNSYLKST